MLARQSEEPFRSRRGGFPVAALVVRPGGKPEGS